MAWDAFPKEVLSEQRPEGSEGNSHVRREELPPAQGKESPKAWREKHLANFWKQEVRVTRSWPVGQGETHLRQGIRERLCRRLDFMLRTKIWARGCFCLVRRSSAWTRNCRRRLGRELSARSFALSRSLPMPPGWVIEKSKLKINFGGRYY